MIKIHVDHAKCDGNGVCMGVAPSVFLVDDEQKLHVLQETVEDSATIRQVRQAVASCPVLAIAIEDE